MAAPSFYAMNLFVSGARIMKVLTVAGLLAFLIAPAAAQQSETGPGTPRSTDSHPLRGPETGTRGPSGGSPDTGYHGPRDVTQDAEPGKQKTAKELEKSGQSQPKDNSVKKN
jgi:hypothetical protein